MDNGHNIKTPAIVTALTLFAAIVSGCGLADEDIKLKYEGYQPAQLNDGWVISTPEAEGFDSAEIERIYEEFFSEDLYPTAHSLLIARNGRLVAEAYCRDKKDRDRFHHTQSATKSITSLLMGMVIDQGLVDSVGTPLYQFYPEYFDDDMRKRAITIKHALTMQTGLEFDNDVNTEELLHGEGNSLEYVLHRDLVFTPGTSFYYHDGNPQLISGVIQKVTGLTEEEFALQNLFNPLGITDYQWERHHDGRTFGAVGLWLKPRDMAKIGKMLVQDGMWEGVQIVSPEWIDESTLLHVPSEHYGYYWWIKDENIRYYALGHGNQVIYVARPEQVTIVMTADPCSSSSNLSPGMLSLLDNILDAIVP